MSGLNFACQLTSNLRGFKSHDFGDSFFHKLRLVLGLTLDVLKGIRSREVTFYFLPRSLSACKHIRHNFAQRFNFKYNERHVHCKLKDSGNHLEQESSTLFQIRQRRLCCSIIWVPETQTDLRRNQNNYSSI